MNLDEFKKKLSQKNEKLIVHLTDPISNKIIKFMISNEKTLSRAHSLFTKEPITIDWIRSFKKNSIFFDIGANIGVYSIFASIINDSTVYSFEPESNNFQNLMDNIFVNNLSEKIIAYPIGITNFSSMTTLYLSKVEKGSSHHMVGKSLSHELKKKNTNFKQGIFSTSINELYNKWNLPIPNYLKIDVDGIEYKIIEQSDLFLANKELRSILIEINSNREEDKNIIDKLKSFDFIYDQKQVDSAMRMKGKHKGYAEYLFYRK